MKKPTEKKLLGISLTTENKKDILEKIIKYTSTPSVFCHIVSINPENIVIAQEDKEFAKIMETAQIKIIDGVGIVVAARLLSIPIGERQTGVDLMSHLIEWADKMRLRVLLIGGKENLAVELANCYSVRAPRAKFTGLAGIRNIQNPEKDEERAIFSIVADYKPHFVFVAFGSPDQEKWIERHKDQFSNCVVMGVGGAFDYLSGKISRPPKFLRNLGLEWLYRLCRQPWRWRRQLKLIKFACLVLQQKLGR